jgi:hypothetical protein
MPITLSDACFSLSDVLCYFASSILYIAVCLKITAYIALFGLLVYSKIICLVQGKSYKHDVRSINLSLSPSLESILILNMKIFQQIMYIWCY